MTKHLADHRAQPTSARVRHFLRLARAPRDMWHRTHSVSGPSRLMHFLRIARGRIT